MKNCTWVAALTWLFRVIMHLGQVRSVQSEGACLTNRDRGCSARSYAMVRFIVYENQRMILKGSPRIQEKLRALSFVWILTLKRWRSFVTVNHAARGRAFWIWFTGASWLASDSVYNVRFVIHKKDMDFWEIHCMKVFPICNQMC